VSRITRFAGSAAAIAVLALAAPAAAKLPCPAAGKTVLVIPQSGVVRVKEPGAKHYIRIRKPRLVKVGSVFDLRHGRASIVSGGPGVCRAPIFTG
jgi:hypothetical protein